MNAGVSIKTMPSLCVYLDEAVLAVVRCDEYAVVSVRVGGTRVDEDFATIDMSAGVYPDAGESTHLTWINQVAFSPGQVVRISFTEAQPTSHAGKTIEELFPGENASAPNEPQSMSSLFQDIRRMEARRPGYRFRVQSPDGTTYKGETNSEEHGFGVTVLWNSHHPERASFSLHSYTIDSVESRSPGRDHIRGRLQIGQAFSVEVGA